MQYLVAVKYKAEGKLVWPTLAELMWEWVGDVKCWRDADGSEVMIAADEDSGIWVTGQRTGDDHAGPVIVRVCMRTEDDPKKVWDALSHWASTLAARAQGTVEAWWYTVYEVHEGRPCVIHNAEIRGGVVEVPVGEGKKAGRPN